MDDYYPWVVLVLTALLVIITWKYVKITGKILEESRLQRIQNAELLKETQLTRLQDVELRTMPKNIEINTNDFEDVMEVKIVSDFPITDRSFTIEDSEGKSITSEGWASIEEEFPSKNQEEYYIEISELNLEKYDTHEPFKLYVTVWIKTFLMHEYTFKFESSYLIRDQEGKLHRTQTALDESKSLFRLIKTETPSSRIELKADIIQQKH